jgi:hypothetical protein
MKIHHSKIRLPEALGPHDDLVADLVTDIAAHGQKVAVPVLRTRIQQYSLDGDQYFDGYTAVEGRRRVLAIREAERLGFGDGMVECRVF